MTRVGLKRPSVSWLGLSITNHMGPSKAGKVTQRLRLSRSHDKRIECRWGMMFRWRGKKWRGYHLRGSMKKLVMVLTWIIARHGRILRDGVQGALVQGERSIGNSSFKLALPWEMMTQEWGTKFPSTCLSEEAVRKEPETQEARATPRG